MFILRKQGNINIDLHYFLEKKIYFNSNKGKHVAQEPYYDSVIFSTLILLIFVISLQAIIQHPLSSIFGIYINLM